MRTVTATLILSLALLLGCDEKSAPPSEAEREAVFDSLSRSVQEAEELEERALQKKREMDDTLKRMEGDSPPEG